MDKVQAAVRDACVHVRAFMNEHATELGPVMTSGACKELDDAIARFSEHAVQQTEHRIGSTGETRKQRSLRLELRRVYLKPIWDVVEAKLAEVPEIATLRLPPSNLRGPRFVDDANAIGNVAEKYASVFIDAGLRPDFLAGLRAHTAELQASFAGRVDHGDKRRGSTIALGTLSQDGRKALKMLDAVIAQQLHDNPQLLAEWKAVRRIPKVGARAATPAEGAAAGTAGQTGQSGEAASPSVPALHAAA